jgi:hypothetical protein
LHDIQQLRFVHHCVQAAQKLDKTLSDYQVKDDLDALLGKLEKKHNNVQKAFKAAVSNAQVLAALTSDADVNGMCSAVVNLAEDLVGKLGHIQLPVALQQVGEERAALCVNNVRNALTEIILKLQEFQLNAVSPDLLTAVQTATGRLGERFVCQLEDEMEGLLFSYEKAQDGVKDTAFTCTQRDRYREQMQDIKKKLQGLVATYNSSRHRAQDVREELSVDALLAGDLPWQYLGIPSKDAPFKLKMELVEAGLRVVRFDEQHDIVLTGMRSFVRYYEQLQFELQLALDTTACQGEFVMPCVLRGLQRCSNQLHFAATSFPAATQSAFTMPVACSQEEMYSRAHNKPLLHINRVITSMKEVIA